jgi:hypothetical protein
MKCRTILAWVFVAAMALVAGCANQISTPPVTVDQYDQPQSSGRAAYPKKTILLYNLQRVLDTDLNTAGRINSLNLVARIGGDEPVVMEQLAGVLGNQASPPELHRAILEFLLRKNYPELAQYVIRVLPHLKDTGPLREVLLEWLTRHPTATVLSEVVKVWADQQPPNPADEKYFQQVVERVSGKPWDQALLEAVNTAGFLSRGSAVEVLARRIPAASLRPRIMEMTARTEAVVVLQSLLKQFDYLPSTGAELVAAASIYKTRQDVLPEVARLAGRWRDQYGYRFNIRDFHLLSRLSHDPRKMEVTRAQLISEMAGVLAKRRHVRHWITRSTLQEDLSIRFDKQVERLTMADLWNLYLLNDMLSRSAVQAPLRVMSEQDRADRRSAWGGQIFYNGGQAQARLYPPDAQVREDDFEYVPSSQSVAEGRNALCRFHAHFDKLANADRAGPSLEELAAARHGNYYSLVLTSLGETSFCAHYYNPRGTVISLGEFPFAR